MLIKDLEAYYNVLYEKNILPAYGWTLGKMSCMVDINDDGQIVKVYSLLDTITRHNKEYLVPSYKPIPMRPTRSSNKVAALLADNSKYMLGFGGDSSDYFKLAKKAHVDLYAKCEHPAAKALVAFFQTWNPNAEHPELEPYTELLEKYNVTFSYQGESLLDVLEIQNIWNSHFEIMVSRLAKGQCLISGETVPICTTHNKIMGVPGGQTSGTCLISFAADSFSSYGAEKETSVNISHQTMCAYTEVLNYMLSEPQYHCTICGITYVFWVESGNFENQQILYNLFDSLQKDIELSIEGFYEDTVHVLGLKANASRLSVISYSKNTLNVLLRNVQIHNQKVLDGVECKVPSFYALLQSNSNPNKTSATFNPQITQGLYNAIFFKKPYPYVFLPTVLERIHKDHIVNSYARSGIIKAVLLDRDIPKEALDVKLNESCTYTPYILGRLFLVLEKTQELWRPVNCTVKDKYFSAASQRPNITFIKLLQHNEHYLKVLKRNDTKRALAIWYEHQLFDLLDMLDESFPATLSTEDQGVFYIGYYHQLKNHYSKKED